MLNRFNRQIDIEVGPVKMMLIQKLNILNGEDRSVLEPREVLKREKMFSLLKEQPQAMLGNLRDFNFGSVYAKRL